MVTLSSSNRILARSTRLSNPLYPHPPAGVAIWEIHLGLVTIITVIHFQ